MGPDGADDLQLRRPVRDRLLRFAAYGVVGVAVGLVVAAFDWVTIEGVLHRVSELPEWQLAIAPGLGLGVTWLILRYPGRQAPTSTSEDFIAAYHDPHDRLRLRSMPARLAAGVATVGSGGALGLEGPSIYAGATVGASVQTRLRWLFHEKDGRMLMVAGAAAGVAAIFKTPATGVLFALEVPYKGDVARRALLPALIASATSYLTFVSFLGTEPIFSVEPNVVEINDELVFERVLEVGFDLGELAAAAALGLVCGLGAQLFARSMSFVKTEIIVRPWWQRWLGASVLLGALAVLTADLYDEPLSFGPDGAEELFDWVTDVERSTLPLLALLFGVRLAATLVTLGGGGVGGVFIPLAIQGLIMGRLAGQALFELDLVTVDTARVLFPAVGVAAFLGAGYRTPLASVVFVAESTGQAGFVVPALIATAVAQVVMGPWSVSSVQRDTRSGHLERRLTLPITSALETEVETVSPTESIHDFVWHHALARRTLVVPVVDEDRRFLGMAHLDDATHLPRDEWERLQVSDIVRRDVPVGRMTWTVREVSEVMGRRDVDVLAVVDASGDFVGVVTDESVVQIDDLLAGGGE